MSKDRSDVELVLACGDTVGESIIWDDRTKRLLWVDLVGKRIHRLDPDSMEHEVWSAPEFVTSIGLREDGGAIVGLNQRLAFWEFSEIFHTLATPEPGISGNRLNEGRVAPDGSFWIGTMATNLTPDGKPKEQESKAGRYYRVTADGVVTCLSDDLYGITNSMIWPTPDLFVTADTALNSLFRYPVAENGTSLHDRAIFGMPFNRGLPDGSCIDADDGIWTCRVAGGACLTRMLPDGSLDQVVELPCSWPTSCTFGGDNLDVLYVTSARFTMDEAHLAAYPQEGGLFALRPGVTGKHEYRFRLA